MNANLREVKRIGAEESGQAENQVMINLHFCVSPRRYFAVFLFVGAF
jgi:hypothetical protein